MISHAPARERSSESSRPQAAAAASRRIAHDMNNLLSVVLGYAELILSDLGAAQSPLRDDILEIRTAARRARELTEELGSVAGPTPKAT